MAEPWERFQGVQTKNAPPSYPYEGPQAAANLQRTQQEVAQSEATAAAKTAQAKAEAQSAQIKAKTDQEQYNINHPADNGTAGLSGPAYMQYLQKNNPGRAAYIQGLAEGRVPFPGAQMMRSAAGQALLADVMRADPTIDATNFTTRAAARKNAATGHLGDSDNNLITAIGHLSRLNTLVPETFGTPATPFNSVANSIDKNFFNGGQTAYEQNQQLAGNELAGAYGAKTEGKQNEGGAQFNEDYSTVQKTKNIYGAVDLLMSKLAANRAQFAYGNGQLSKPDFMLLPPGVREQVMSLPGGRAIAAKYFAGIPVMGQNDGGNGNPGSGGNTPPAPPTSPDYSTMTPSDTGLNMALASGNLKTQYDAQTSALVNGYLRKGMSYSDALKQLAVDAPGANLAGLTTPTQWNAALKYAQQPGHENVNLVAATKQVPMSMGEQIFNPIAQNPGGAFAGHYYNNLFLGLPDKLAGKDQSAAFNALSDQQNPWSSFAGDALGMAGGASLMGKGVGAVADAGAELPVIGRYLRSIGLNPAPGLTGEEARMAQTAAAIRRNITGDQISAGITGANNNPDHPLIGAAANMAAMGAGNLVGRAVVGPSLAWLGDTAPGQAVINGARSLGAMVKKQFGGVPATPFSPPPAPDISLSRTTQNALPDITAKMQQAQSAGLPYMIADADPRLRAMLGSATRFSPNVQASAESILQPRQLGQGERAIGQINSNLAPVGDVPTMQANLLKSAQSQSAPLYDAAKAQPVPELTANPGLAEVLDRPAGQAAIRKGWERALNNGEDVGTLTYATDPSGNTVQYGNPSWNVIHYARQALDANGDTSVRQALDKQIAGLNPGFKAADAAYAGTMKGSDALQAGSEATETKVTPEATQQALAGFPNNGPQFQQGYASNMADMIGRQRMSGNPYDLVNGSMFQKEKLGTVFPQGADAFNAAQSLEGDMGKTYQSVLGGSPTQPRALDDKRFGLSLGDLADGGVDAGVAAMTGNPASLGMLFLRKGIDAAKFGMNAQKADAIAPFLMNPDPGANLAALSTWAQQNAARKAYLKQVNNMGMRLGAGALGAPAISWASQN